MISGEGGFVSYIGTNSFFDVENAVKDGDEKVKFIQDAFVYQLCKEIGAMSTVVNGNVEAIVLTGGAAYYKKMVEEIKEKVSYIAPVVVYPGEDEMGALASNALAVLEGTEQIKVY